MPDSNSELEKLEEETAAAEAVEKAPRESAKGKAKDDKAERRAKESKKRTQSISRYFRETWAELKKIVWPTPKQTLNNTLVVLFFMLVLGAFIWGLDTLTTLAFTTLVGGK